MDIGFTPYFDKNLKELRGPIPLTIFNKQWQDLANSYHVEKRVKTNNLNKDITPYTGYPYPHEMTQTYASWNVNYRNFVLVLRNVYNFKTFANWAEIHQSNVEFYHERDNWMTDFWYNIKMRWNAFAFWVLQGKTNAPPDISQRREDIPAICFAETRRLDEASFTDNPYAKGGTRFGYDWTTGLPRSQTTLLQVPQTTILVTIITTQTTTTTNKPDLGHRSKSGYNGRNFDPKYAAKKAAAAKPPTGNGNT
ncbi:uncharacterized protein MELLADRAFT_111249 [Melampsora larici-populina 98AG31]|uniref:Uncharacterized protein n=1 Tax=Melampsora larici-populina (strain 98AG31 / pathotype 3-4-7) TaxID=747676 RepID=F4S2I7_MELLP|nr:uncharacterized protein MELLADRAFT_111249 [Melampsora larici-populina 98AG31]EGG01186.1 hypothetical protein MELLADRAFT_111249 [Melampsora larici-populina 98AG31]